MCATENRADLEKVHLYNFGGCTIIMRKRRQCILTPVLYRTDDDFRWAMTPAFADGELLSVSGGSNPIHLIYAPRGCAGIWIGIMSAKADTNPVVRPASES